MRLGATIRHAGRGHPLSLLDRLGIFLSSICLAHCLALPLVVALLPAIAPLLPPDPWVHAVLIGLALPITGFTLWRGYLAHRNPRPPLIGAGGLGIVLCGLLAEAGLAASILTVVGGLIVAGAHLMNLRDHSALSARADFAS